MGGAYHCFRFCLETAPIRQSSPVQRVIYLCIYLFYNSAAEVDALGTMYGAGLEYTCRYDPSCDLDVSRENIFESSFVDTRFFCKSGPRGLRGLPSWMNIVGWQLLMSTAPYSPVCRNRACWIKPVVRHAGSLIVEAISLCSCVDTIII